MDNLQVLCTAPFQGLHGLGSMCLIYRGADHPQVQLTSVGAKVLSTSENAGLCQSCPTLECFSSCFYNHCQQPTPLDFLLMGTYSPQSVTICNTFSVCLSLEGTSFFDISWFSYLCFFLEELYFSLVFCSRVAILHCLVLES